MADVRVTDSIVGSALITTDSNVSSGLLDSNPLGSSSITLPSSPAQAIDKSPTPTFSLFDGGIFPNTLKPCASIEHQSTPFTFPKTPSAVPMTPVSLPRTIQYGAISIDKETVERGTSTPLHLRPALGSIATELDCQRILLPRQDSPNGSALASVTEINNIDYQAEPRHTLTNSRAPSELSVSVFDDSGYEAMHAYNSRAASEDSASVFDDSSYVAEHPSRLLPCRTPRSNSQTNPEEHSLPTYSIATIPRSRSSTPTPDHAQRYPKRPPANTPYFQQAPTGRTHVSSSDLRSVSISSTHTSMTEVSYAHSDSDDIEAGFPRKRLIIDWHDERVQKLPRLSELGGVYRKSTALHSRALLTPSDTQSPRFMSEEPQPHMCRTASPVEDDNDMLMEDSGPPQDDAAKILAQVERLVQQDARVIAAAINLAHQRSNNPVEHTSIVAQLHALLDAVVQPGARSRSYTAAKRRNATAKQHKPSSTDADHFYRRLLRFKLTLVPEHTSFLSTLIARPTLKTLFAIYDHTGLHPPHGKQRQDVEAARFLASALSFIHVTDVRSEQVGVVRMLLCIFLFVAQFDDFTGWVAEASNSKRRWKVDWRLGERLWEKYQLALRSSQDEEGGVFVYKREDFVATVHAQIVYGGKLAFLARGTSISTLVYLYTSGLLTFTNLNRCSKGGEASGISGRVLKHLKDSGSVRRGNADGLERVLHLCLWEMAESFHGEVYRVVDGAQWTEFPGFEATERR